MHFDEGSKPIAHHHHFVLTAQEGRKRRSQSASPYRLPCDRQTARNHE